MRRAVMGCIGVLAFLVLVGGTVVPVAQAATPGPDCSATSKSGAAGCTVSYTCPAIVCTLDATVQAKARLFLHDGTVTVATPAGTTVTSCTPRVGNSCSTSAAGSRLTLGQSAVVRCTATPRVGGLGGATVACGTSVTEEYGVRLTAHLTGSQVAPPNASPAVGDATVLVDVRTSEVCWTVPVTGLTGSRTLTTLHRAPPGVTGPAVRVGLGTSGSAETFCGTDNPLGPTFPNALDMAAHPDDYYVTVHSTTFPGGEIRGQLHFAP